MAKRAPQSKPTEIRVQPPLSTGGVDFSKKLWLVTDYPTLNDPFTKFAYGLVTADTKLEAQQIVIRLLAAGGLNVTILNATDVEVTLWDDDKEGVQLYYG